MAGRILTVEYNILLSGSFDKICCIVNVELHPDYNNLVFFLTLQYKTTKTLLNKP